MLKPVLILLVLLLCLFAATAARPNAPNHHPNSSTIPAEAAQQVNPVKPTPESLAQGKKYYGYDCAMCHGANGNGKGEVAVDEKMTLGDFSDPATLKDKTDGELFYIIKNGKRSDAAGGRSGEAPRALEHGQLHSLACEERVMRVWTFGAVFELQAARLGRDLKDNTVAMRSAVRSGAVEIAAGVKYQRALRR